MNQIGFNEFGDLRGGGRSLWEHRPRCDEGDGGLRGLIAAGAPLLQGGEQRCLGDGGWSAGLDRGEGDAPTKKARDAIGLGQ